MSRWEIGFNGSVSLWRVRASLATSRRRADDYYFIYCFYWRKYLQSVLSAFHNREGKTPSGGVVRACVRVRLRVYGSIFGTSRKAVFSYFAHLCTVVFPCRAGNVAVLLALIFSINSHRSTQTGAQRKHLFKTRLSLECDWMNLLSVTFSMVDFCWCTLSLTTKRTNENTAVCWRSARWTSRTSRNRQTCFKRSLLKVKFHYPRLRLRLTGFF